MQKARAHFLSQKPPPADLVMQGVMETFEVDVSIEKQKETLKKIRGTVGSIKNAIENQNFELKGCNTGHCRYCEYREICPGYSQWEKIDKTTPRPLPYDLEREEEMNLVTEEGSARKTS